MAGNYAGLGNGGPASSAFLLNAITVYTDHVGNIYLAELVGRVRQIGMNGMITAIAGNPTNTALGDGGLAIQAVLSVNYGLTSDTSGNLYISEFQGCRIRRVNLQSGVIVTVAGTGTCGFTPDGPLAAAALNSPSYMVIDAQGRLIFVEGNRIRRIDLTAGTLTTVAGTGTAGLTGDGGPANMAQINAVGGLAEDALGNLFFTERDDCLVRSISITTGNLTTIAGTGCGYSGDGGAALAGQLNSPGGIAVNPAGNLVYEWESGRIRQINLDSHLITAFAGTGNTGNAGDSGLARQAQIPGSGSLGFDHSGNLLLLETSQLRSINSQGIISTVAGANSAAGDGGQATAARLSSPTYAVSDGKGGFAINDVGNRRIRAVSASGVITTVAGGLTTATTSTGDGGLAINALLGFVQGGAMVYDSAGNLYFTESGFSDASSNKLRKIGTDGVITRIGSIDFAVAGGIAFDRTQRFLYVTELNGNRVDKVDVATGVATTFAGRGAPGDTVDGGFSGDGGPAIQAQLFDPVAIAVDAAGNVYVEDGGNARIRRISPSGDMIQTVAGNGIEAGLAGEPPLSGDGGQATAASINAFYGIASDANGNLYIAEGNKIRRVDAVSGIITTIAGGDTAGSSGDGGAALTARINAHGVSLGADGVLLIADTGNNRIRALTDINVVLITSVDSAGQFPGIAQNAWIEIKGVNLSPASVGVSGMLWSNAPEFASGRMPIRLASVGVLVNGKPAYVYFVSQAQINVLVPLDTAQGPVLVVVTNGANSSPAFTVNMNSAAPSFIPIAGGQYVVATHTDGSLVGPPSLSVPGYSFTPAKAGETIVFYAFGFGLPTTPLTDGSAFQTGSLPSLPAIQIGFTPAVVRFAGLISPGLYQFNVTVPASVASGDNALTASYAGLTTPAGTLLTVQ